MQYLTAWTFFDIFSANLHKVLENMEQAPCIPHREVYGCMASCTKLRRDTQWITYSARNYKSVSPASALPGHDDTGAAGRRKFCLSDGRESANTTHVTKWESNTAQPGESRRGWPPAVESGRWRWAASCGAIVRQAGVVAPAVGTCSGACPRGACRGGLWCCAGVWT